MGKRNTTDRFRNQLIEFHGDKCINCGSSDRVEFHHIVPVALGGTDTPSNIVPLCYICHKAAHIGRKTEDIKKSIGHEKGGRKCKIDDETFEGAFKKYIGGQIGKAKFCELIGRNYKSLSRIPQIKRFKEKYGIEEFRNNIDIRGTISELKDGDPVGYIKYLDGREEIMFYHDTGENNVEYKRANRTRNAVEIQAEIRKNESEAEREERKKNYNDFQRTLDKILNAS